MNNAQQTEPWICPMCNRKFKIPVGTERDLCPECESKTVLKRSGSRSQTDDLSAWYFQRRGDERVEGPLSIDQLAEMYSCGDLTEHDWVRQGRKGELIGVFSVPEIVRAAPHSGLIAVTDGVPLRDGESVDRVFSVISARRVFGVNIVGDWLGAMRDIIGGRSATLERTAAQIEAELIADIRHQAGELGANRVLGYRIEIGNLAGGGSFMMYGFAQGTPVVVSQSPRDGAEAEAYFDS